MKENRFPYQFSILESVQHGVVVIDYDGNIVFWNSSATAMLGYTREEVIGKPAHMFHSKENAPLSELLSQCRRDEIAEQRWTGIHRNGDCVWMDVRLSTYKEGNDANELCVISMYDIGELLQTEKKLHDNLALTNAIFRASDDAMVILHKNGDLHSVNRAAMEMFGYNEPELKGKNISDLLASPHNVNPQRYIQSFFPKAGHGVSGKLQQLHAIKKDGTVFPIELAVGEVQNEGEHFFTGIIRDITLRRTLEKEIISVGDEERRKIGRELHDGLGQMLTGIRMLSEALAKRLKANALPGADEVGEITEIIREADEYARTLSRGMVVVDVEKNGLSVALENLAKRITHLTGVDVHFIDTGRTEIEHHTMALHLYRIAQEGVNNAIRHGQATRVNIRLYSNPEHTSLIVEDNGIGFDKSLRKNGAAVQRHREFSDDEDENNIKNNDTGRQGVGMHIMKYRAHVMGGILKIDRTDDEITRLRCVVPNDLQYF